MVERIMYFVRESDQPLWAAALVPLSISPAAAGRAGTLA